MSLVRRPETRTTCSPLEKTVSSYPCTTSTYPLKVLEPKTRKKVPPLLRLLEKFPRSAFTKSQQHPSCTIIKLATRRICERGPHGAPFLVNYSGRAPTRPERASTLSPLLLVFFASSTITSLVLYFETGLWYSTVAPRSVCLCGLS